MDGFDFSATSGTPPAMDFLPPSEPSLLAPADISVGETQEDEGLTVESPPLETLPVVPSAPVVQEKPVVFPEFKKLQDQRLADVKERETKASQAVQERKAAAAEMRKQMKEERAKLTALRKTKNREDEKEFVLQRDATLSAGKDWQRVGNLIDVTAKTESTRMREVLVGLKQ